MATWSRQSTGVTVPVRWVGRQTISTIFADPLRVLPICIKAGALAENVPSRDLYVSPDHAILIDEILVHASALVNGTSIVRAPAPAQTFTYYHVELADHSLLLADNVPAESFIETLIDWHSITGTSTKRSVRRQLRWSRCPIRAPKRPGRFRWPCASVLLHAARPCSAL